MTRYVYLGNYDDVNFFFQNWWNLSMFALKLLKNTILDFFKTHPIRKSKLLFSAVGAAHLGIKNALKQSHTFIELRLCNIYSFTDVSCFKTFSEPTGNQGAYMKTQNVHIWLKFLQNMNLVNMVTVKKCNASFRKESLWVESSTTVCLIKYQLLAVMLLKYHNGQLLVVVDHNQLRTMASEMVYPITWSNWLVVNPTLMYPWTPRAQYKSMQPVQDAIFATISIWGNHLAYAVTQGMSFS